VSEAERKREVRAARRLTYGLLYDLEPVAMDWQQWWHELHAKSWLGTRRKQDMLAWGKLLVTRLRALADAQDKYLDALERAE